MVVAEAGGRDWVVTRVTVVVETVSGLRVSGPRESGVTGSDLPLIRLPDGRPYVPGSSVKGVLRSAAERVLAGQGIRVCDVLDPNARCGGQGGAGGQPIDHGVLCWPCRLFGSPHWAGRLWCGDLVPDEPPPTVVRDGVAIDRGELRAADGRKYDYEVVPPGVRLRGEVRVDDPDPGDVGLVLALWDLVDSGVVTFGGGATRGLGRVRLVEPLSPCVWRASGWEPGATPLQLDGDAARAELHERIESEQTATAGRVSEEA